MSAFIRWFGLHPRHPCSDPSKHLFPTNHMQLQTASQPALGLGTVTQQRPRTRWAAVNSMSAGGAWRQDDFPQFGLALWAKYFDHKRKSGISPLKLFGMITLKKVTAQSAVQYKQISILCKCDERRKWTRDRRSAAGIEAKSLLTCIIFADLLWSGAAEETGVAAGPCFTETSQEAFYVFSVGGSFNLSDTPSSKYRRPSGEHWAGDVILRRRLLNDSLGC